MSMDEKMTRDEALVAAAVWIAQGCAWAYAEESVKKSLRGPWVPPQYTAALSGGGGKIGRGYDGTPCVTVTGGGGWGGDHEPPDAPDGYWWRRCQDAEARAADNARTRDDMEGDCRKANLRCGEALRANKDLESRLAAAEKRAEEAERAMARHSQDGGCAWYGEAIDAIRERDATGAEIAEWKEKYASQKLELLSARSEAGALSGNLVAVVEERDDAIRQRDEFQWRMLAAEKRADVAELQRDALKAELDKARKSSHIDMSALNVDGVRYTPEKIRVLERQLREIKADSQSAMAAMVRARAETAAERDAANARVKEVEADADALRSIIVKMEVDFEAIRADKDRYENGLAQIATALRDFSKMVPEIEAWLTARAAAGAQP